jgi:hypothetical protein
MLAFVIAEVYKVFQAMMNWLIDLRGLEGG